MLGASAGLARLPESQRSHTRGRKFSLGEGAQVTSGLKTMDRVRPCLPLRSSLGWAWVEPYMGAGGVADHCTQPGHSLAP